MEYTSFCLYIYKKNHLNLQMIKIHRFTGVKYYKLIILYIFVVLMICHNFIVCKIGGKECFDSNSIWRFRLNIFCENVKTRAFLLREKAVKAK